MAGTYRDLLGGTIGLTIMIHAILHVTADALDMILVGSGASAHVCFTIHFIILL
jgi:hypothetical protein